MYVMTATSLQKKANFSIRQSIHWRVCSAAGQKLAFPLL